MLSETSKDIVGQEGRYAITLDGRVYSHSRVDYTGRLFKGRWLRPQTDKYGYLKVSLSRGSRALGQDYKMIHRLVAEAFIPNPDNLPCINHKDGNKINNLVDNLEWVSWKDNTVHAWKMGLCKPYDRAGDYNREGIIASNKRRRKHGI